VSPKGKYAIARASLGNKHYIFKEAQLYALIVPVGWALAQQYCQYTPFRWAEAAPYSKVKKISHINIPGKYLGKVFYFLLIYMNVYVYKKYFIITVCIYSISCALI
jgi:hypothetical protein